MDLGLHFQLNVKATMRKKKLQEIVLEYLESEEIVPEGSVKIPMKDSQADSALEIRRLELEVEAKKIAAELEEKKLAAEQETKRLEQEKKKLPPKKLEQEREDRKIAAEQEVGRLDLGDRKLAAEQQAEDK